MIKIAMLLASVSRRSGGLFESVRRLGQSLHENAIEVDVFAARDEFTGEDSDRWKPLILHTFEPLRPYSFSYAPHMKKELLRGKYDITQCHGVWQYPSLANLQHAKLTKTPYIISTHGMLDPWAVRNSLWKKKLAGLIYEDAHLKGASCLRALCTSEVQAIRKYGLKNPVCRIPNGIDLNNLDISVPPPWQGAIDKGKKILLYLGRIHPKKGLVNLLKAWSMAIKSNSLFAKEWALVIAGWDQLNHETELKRMAREIDLEKNVYFAGPQFGENKKSAYKHADAFVLPSLSEGLPMAVLEAWAQQLPVIMTPECNLPEGFEVGAAMKILANPENIQEGLIRLSSMSDDERVRMGENGLELVGKEFAWPKIAADMKSVYEWILGGGKPPECVSLN